MSAWDSLAGTFASKVDEQDIPASAADNVLIAWPSIFTCFEQSAIPTSARVLDFGCGGGRFVAELNRRGYDAAGIDTSRQMIKAAKRAYKNESFHVSGTSSDFGTFDIIVSVMALQFVEGIDGAFADFAGALRTGGLLAFAVHNPDYVEDAMQRGKFPPYEEGRRTAIRLGKEVIPLFVRDENEYDTLATECGFERRYIDKPPFTQEFTDRYGPVPNPYPEYLILGYVKTA